MIVNDKDAATRLNSPMNLINKLKNPKSDRKSAMGLFGIGRQTTEKSVEVEVIKNKVEIIKPNEEIIISFNPFQAKEKSSSLVPIKSPSQVPQEEKLDNILEDHEAKIKLGLAHDKAIELLNRSVDMLTTKLDDIKADKLPSVISAASKTVESIRRERNESNKNNKADKEVHYHFYTPEQKNVSDYKIIDVG